jgi:hypothetical protein
VKWESLSLLFRELNHLQYKDTYKSYLKFSVLIYQLIDTLTNAKNADVKQVGIEWAIQQSLELKAAGVLHWHSIWENQRILDKS